MVWDKTLPDGAKSIALGDDDIRANNTALETALDREHRFASGGNQSGIHAFTPTTTSLLNAQGDATNGSMGYSTDERAGELTLMVHDGTSFVPADCGKTNIPRTDEQSTYSVAQFSNVDSLTLTAGGGPSGVDLLQFDLLKSSYQDVTLSADAHFGAPLNDLSGKVTSILAEVRQGAASAGSVTFDSSVYVSAFGATPFISTGLNDVNLLQFTKLSSGLWLVSAAADLGSF